MCSRAARRRRSSASGAAASASASPALAQLQRQQRAHAGAGGTSLTNSSADSPASLFAFVPASSASPSPAVLAPGAAAGRDGPARVSGGSTAGLQALASAVEAFLTQQQPQQPPHLDPPQAGSSGLPANPFSAQAHASALAHKAAAGGPSGSQPAAGPPFDAAPALVGEPAPAGAGRQDASLVRRPESR